MDQAFPANNSQGYCNDDSSPTLHQCDSTEARNRTLPARFHHRYGNNRGAWLGQVNVSRMWQQILFSEIVSMIWQTARIGHLPARRLNDIAIRALPVICLKDVSIKDLQRDCTNDTGNTQGPGLVQQCLDDIAVRALPTRFMKNVAIKGVRLDSINDVAT